MTPLSSNISWPFRVRLLILFILLSGCSSSTPTRKFSPDSPSVESARTETVPVNVHTEDNIGLDRHRLLVEIMEMMGTPYIFSGFDTNGIDCSGFTTSVFRDGAGKILPRSSQEQFMLGTAVERRELKFGDLVFFRMDGRAPDHVGVYVGDGLFAHASMTLGVTISLLDSEYYKNRYAGARRIVREISH